MMIDPFSGPDGPGLLADWPASRSPIACPATVSCCNFPKFASTSAPITYSLPLAAGTLREAIVFTESNEVITPRDDFPVRTYRTLQKMKTRRPIIIVSHVLFTGPEKLYRHTDLLGDICGLDHVIVR